MAVQSRRRNICVRIQNSGILDLPSFRPQSHLLADERLKTSLQQEIIRPEKKHMSKQKQLDRAADKQPVLTKWYLQTNLKLFNCPGKVIVLWRASQRSTNWGLLRLKAQSINHELPTCCISLVYWTLPTNPCRSQLWVARPVLTHAYLSADTYCTGCLLIVKVVRFTEVHCAEKPCPLQRPNPKRSYNMFQL